MRYVFASFHFHC
jgi:hypothetical protein